MRHPLLTFLFFAVPTVDHDMILAVFVTTNTAVFAANTLLHNTLHLREREKRREGENGVRYGQRGSRRRSEWRGREERRIQ